MRRYIARFLVLCLCIPILVLDAEAQEDFVVKEDTTIMELLAKSEDANVSVPPLNPNHLPKEFRDYDFGGTPILVALWGDTRQFAAEPNLEKTIALAQEKGEIQYIWLKDDPVYFLASKEPYRLYIPDSTPTYLRDIIDGKVMQSFCGQEYAVEKIVFLESCWPPACGWVVYYVTDGGTFVRYYSNAVAEAVEFTYAEFQPYAAAYYEYIQSPDYKPEDGYVGGPVRFLEFYGNPKKYGIEFNEDNIPIFVGKKHNCGVPVMIGISIFVTGVAVIFLCYRKKYTTP